MRSLRSVLKPKHDFSSCDVVYMPHWLGKLALPVSKSDTCEYEAINGEYQFRLIAPSEIGLPFGSYPRLILCYLTTMAVLTQRKDIALGCSERAFLQALGRSNSGGGKGAVNAFRGQLRRLFSSCLYYESASADRTVWGQYILADGGVLTWLPGSAGEKWSAEIVLSQRFFLDAVHRSFPVRRETIIALSKSPSQMDIYCWLTSRAFSLTKPTQITWAQLYAQFGNNFSRLVHFRQHFAQTMLCVKSVYPEINYQLNQNGIRLRPFKPDVKPVNSYCG